METDVIKIETKGGKIETETVQNEFVIATV